MLCTYDPSRFFFFFQTKITKKDHPVNPPAVRVQTHIYACSKRILRAKNNSIPASPEWGTSSIFGGSQSGALLCTLYARTPREPCPARMILAQQHSEHVTWTITPGVEPENHSSKGRAGFGWLLLSLDTVYNLVFGPNPELAHRRRVCSLAQPVNINRPRPLSPTSRKRPHTLNPDIPRKEEAKRLVNPPSSSRCRNINPKNCHGPGELLGAG